MHAEYSCGFCAFLRRKVARKILIFRDGRFLMRKRHFSVGETKIKSLFSVNLLQLNLKIQRRSFRSHREPPTTRQTLLRKYTFVTLKNNLNSLFIARWSPRLRRQALHTTTLSFYLYKININNHRLITGIWHLKNDSPK